MSVTLSPIAPRYAVSDADDPFKKYWWAILLGIGFTAMWLLLPMLGEQSVGSTKIDAAKPKSDAAVEQNFSSEGGDGGYLSMDGAVKKRKDDPLFSGSLTFPTPEGGETPADGKTAAAAAGGAAGAASGSLASALKQVASENGGWGDKKAQRGFDAPKLSGTGMSGLGAASGGRAGSAGGSSSAFGSANANVGFGRAGGLSGTAKDDIAPEAKASVAALQAAASKSVEGANNSSNDAARSSLAQAFDGAKAGSKIGGPGGAAGARYENLDTAPINLKLADPKLNEKKLEAPPMTDIGESKSNDDSQMAKQMAMQIAAGVVGGMIGGPVGGIITNVVMQAIERQQAQEQKVRELEEKQQLDRAARRMGASTSK